MSTRYAVLCEQNAKRNNLSNSLRVIHAEVKDAMRRDLATLATPSRDSGLEDQIRQLSTRLEGSLQQGVDVRVLTQIEDQILPKKCGHLNDKRLASCDDMAAKVAAAAKARRHLYIIARTDALASEGMDGAVARAKAYIAAGADAIFPEALVTADMFKEFAQRVQAPILANMTEFGRTPYFTKDEFAQMGCKMVIWPVSALRMAGRAHQDLYAEIARAGSAEAMVPRMQTRTELYQTIGYHEFESLDASIAKSVAP